MRDMLESGIIIAAIINISLLVGIGMGIVSTKATLSDYDIKTSIERFGGFYIRNDLGYTCQPINKQIKASKE